MKIATTPRLTFLTLMKLHPGGIGWTILQGMALTGNSTFNARGISTLDARVYFVDFVSFLVYFQRSPSGS